MKTLQDLKKDLAKFEVDLKRRMKAIPKIMGVEAVKMARLQIDKGGSLNGGLKPWKKRTELPTIPRATGIKKGKDGKYRPGKVYIGKTDQFTSSNKGLLRQRGNLYRAISWRISGDQVSVGVDLATIPYAKIHNEGGDIPITAKMRAFFNMKYRQTGNPFWLGMSRHKGNKITMPKRQYLALTPELKQAVERAVYRYLLDQIANLKRR